MVGTEEEEEEQEEEDDEEQQQQQQEEEEGTTLRNSFLARTILATYCAECGNNDPKKPRFSKDDKKAGHREEEQNSCSRGVCMPGCEEITDACLARQAEPSCQSISKAQESFTPSIALGNA